MQSSYPQPHADRKSGEGASEIFTLNSYVAGDWEKTSNGSTKLIQPPGIPISKYIIYTPIKSK